MIYLESFWSKKKKNTPQLLKPITKPSDYHYDPISEPRLFGDIFTISFYCDEKKAQNVTSALHNMSQFGVSSVGGPTNIRSYIIYLYSLFNSFESFAETLEILCQDYINHVNSDSDKYFSSIEFRLNKQQMQDFLDLLKAASKGNKI